MKILFESCLAYRNLLLKQTENLTENQFDIIPAGFKNNIRWQMAHIISSQLLLTCFKSGGTLLLIDNDFIAGVRKGTFPADMKHSGLYSSAKLRELLISVPAELENNWAAFTSKPYERYMTSTGLELTSLEQALAFSNVHDGLHIGSILAQMKLIS